MTFQFSDEKWFVPLEKYTEDTYTNKEESIFKCRKRGKELLEQESEKARQIQRESDIGDAKWLRKMLTSGTLTDKMGAMASLVQNDPVHNMDMLESLLAMANKKGKREAQLSIQSLRELFTYFLLPDRPLRYISQQPLEVEGVDDKTIILFYFEHLLKQKYAEFIELLKKYSFDNQAFFKKIAITSIFQLLESKPEQEQALLIMLVEKIGDPDTTISSHAVYLLLKLVRENPYMRIVVSKEVRQLLIRSDISIKAVYYGTCFLNQLEFSSEDNDFAVDLIGFYFSLFRKYATLTLEADQKQKQKKQKKRKNRKQTKTNTVEDANETRLKLLAGILTGINRAMPYGNTPEVMINKQLDTLYYIVHCHHWACSVQAMLLLFTIVSNHPSYAPRYYRALYTQILSPEFLHSTKNSLFLNLLYRSLKHCTDRATAIGLLKRVLQCALMMPAAMACGLLFMVSTVMKERDDLALGPRLHSMLVNHSFDNLCPEEVKEEIGNEHEKKEESEKEKEESEEEKEESEEEEVKDLDESDDVKDLDESFFSDQEQNKEEEQSEPEQPEQPEPEPESRHPSESTSSLPPVHYNLYARDPAFSHAEDTLFFELSLLEHHYHPTVVKYAQILLQGGSIVCDGDPLTDFSNKAFLDKFAYRHAKKKDIENARNRGSTVLQPKKRGSLRTEPVNSESFLQQKEEDIAVEDRFFYKFFKERARRGEGKKKKSEVSSDDEAAMDAFAEGLAEDMMKDRVGSEGEDIDDDFGDLEDQFEEEENGRFLEEGEEVEDDMDVMDDMEEPEEDEDHMIVDEGDNGSRKKTQDHKKKMKSLYASAEEFEAMLEETAQARKEREETFKKRSHKRGRGNGGKKGFNGKRRK